MVCSTERSIKPITNICCSLDAWHTSSLYLSLSPTLAIVLKLGINNPHHKKVPS